MLLQCNAATDSFPTILLRAEFSVWWWVFNEMVKKRKPMQKRVLLGACCVMQWSRSIWWLCWCFVTLFLTTWLVLVSDKSVKKARPWQYSHCPACWDNRSESYVNEVARPRDRVHDCMGVREERCGKLPNVILTSCKWGSNSIQLKH